jgi:hypothetical protein
VASGRSTLRFADVNLSRLQELMRIIALDTTRPSRNDVNVAPSIELSVTLLKVAYSELEPCHIALNLSGGILTPIIVRNKVILTGVPLIGLKTRGSRLQVSGCSSREEARLCVVSSKTGCGNLEGHVGASEGRHGCE